MPLAWASLPCRNEPKVVPSPSPIDEDDASPQIEPEGQEPFLTRVGIIARQGAGILKHPDGVGKGHAVLPEVFRGLSGFHWNAME